MSFSMGLARIHRKDAEVMSSVMLPAESHPKEGTVMTFAKPPAPS